MGFTVKRVLRRVLRRGSEKGLSRRCLERLLGEYPQLGVRPNQTCLCKLYVYFGGCFFRVASLSLTRATDRRQSFEHLEFLDTEYDRAKVPQYNGSDPVPLEVDKPFWFHPYQTKYKTRGRKGCEQAMTRNFLHSFPLSCTPVVQSYWAWSFLSFLCLVIQYGKLANGYFVNRHSQ